MKFNIIQASVNEGWREPCLQGCERTERNNGESSNENLFKNSAMNQDWGTYPTTLRKGLVLFLPGI